MSIESKLEDDVIAFIKAQVTQLANKSVEAYAGQNPEEWANNRVVTDPACMVHVGEHSINLEDEAQQFLLQSDTEFFIYIKGRNIRSHDETKDDIYTILQTIRNALHGVRVGGVMFMLQQQGPAYIDTRLSIYFQKYLVNLNLINRG